MTELATATNEDTIGTMYVMDASGHKDSMRWSDNPASQAAARDAFNTYKRQGFTMFVMGEDDQKGRKLDEFDPGVKAFLAVAPLQGG